MSTTLTASTATAAADIPAAVWNGLAPQRDGRVANPFLEHAFFLALEQSGSATRRTGWQPQHILLRDPVGTTVGLMPAYAKTNSQGEYVFDHQWADAYERAGGRYYPKLQASVPFTPATAPKLLTGGDDPQLKIALLRAAEEVATQRGYSSIHATFVPEEEAGLSERAGWMHRTDTQFHWFNEGFGSFEEFLGSMSSRHRKSTRRERRDALGEQGLTVRWLTGADLTESVWDAFFEFYMDTGSRKWGHPYLNRPFFSLLSQAMGDRVLLIFAYDGDTPVAGTLNMIGTDTLYGRYWGATRQVPFLHFELCYYQSIDYAIAHGLKKVEAGAQGEHKLARGYVPTTTHSMHWIGHEGLRSAVADYLVRERRSVERSQTMMEDMLPFARGPQPDEN